MDVPVELARIVISEHGDHQTIYLREKGGERMFPILIGFAEAAAIRRRLHREPVPRPMTHDLLANLLEALGGRLEKIVISDIRQLDPSEFQQTFIATLHVRRNGELIEVDARPSDAVALGVGFDTPLFVAEHVLDAAVENKPSLEEQVHLLRLRREMLAKQIQELSERLSDQKFLAKIVQDQRRRLAEMKAEHEAISRLLEKIG